MTGLYARIGGAQMLLLYGAYRHGVTVTDLVWQAKWSKQVGDQSMATTTT